MPQTRLPTIWDVEPHTIAKHKILEEYLKAWAPIIGRWEQRIVYIDGFAGPGKYKGGESGSPIMAIDAIMNNSNLKESTEVIFWFIEKDKERSEVLKQILKSQFNMPVNMKYVVDNSEFEDSLCSQLDNIEQQKQILAPTFAFLDPFGYSGFPMELIQRLLKHDKSEVLITFMSGFVNRFLDPEHEDAITRLYGAEDFLQAKSIKKTDERITFLLQLYAQKLQEQGGARFVRTFEMKRNDNQVVYHLIFGTKHWKGLEVMKKSMIKVDDRGTYSFSDRLGFGQTFFTSMRDGTRWMERAACEIFDKFHGTTVSVEAIHEFVITNTQYTFKKEILKILEKESPPKIIHVTNRQKAFRYPNGCQITFLD